MKQIGVNKFIFALAAVLYIAKHVTIQIFRARTTSNSQTHKHTQRDFTLVPLTRALALVYYYIHKVYTRKKKYRLTACIHQSVKKQNAQHTGIDIFQFMMLALWTVVSKQFFLSPILGAYQHTHWQHGIPLGCIWAVCSQKNHSKNYVYSAVVATPDTQVCSAHVHST